MNSDTESARAFNLGADARHYGLPLSANPHDHEDRTRWNSWRNGWNEVDRYWGAWVKRKVPRLPRVEEDAA